MLPDDQMALKGTRKAVAGSYIKTAWLHYELNLISIILVGE